MREHEQRVKEKATDLIHAVSLDTTHPFTLYDCREKPVGAIKDEKLLKRLQFVGIYAYKKDLEGLGETELADMIVTKGKTVLLDNES